MAEYRAHMKHFQIAVISAFLTLMLVAGYQAMADQSFLTPEITAQATRACSFAGEHAQPVTVTSATNNTSLATGKGMVRIACTATAHYYQGVLGVTGPTAGTGDSLVGPLSPEYVYSTGGKIAFIRDSADGTCFVTNCK